VRLLREALQVSAEEQEALDAVLIRSSTVSAHKVEEFKAALVSGWREQRLLADLFMMSERYEVHQDEEAAPETIWRDELLPKKMFLEKSSYGSNDMFGRDVGGRVAQGQFELELSRISKSERTGEPGPSLVADLRTEVSEMARSGLAPKTILIPASRYAMKELALLTSAGHASAPSEWSHLPAATRSYRGEFEGIPVFQYFSRTFADRVFLIDTAAWATWKEWMSPEVAPEGLGVELREFDKEGALQYLKDKGMTGSDGDGVFSDTQVEEVMGQVRLRVSERFALEVADSRAAVRIGLPER
jgi:hypothetical protein